MQDQLIPLTSQTTGASLAESLLVWMENSDREIGRELTERAGLELRATVAHLVEAIGVESHILIDLNTLDDFFDFKLMANAALIPGGEGQKRLEDKLRSSFESLNSRLERLKIEKKTSSAEEIKKLQIFTAHLVKMAEGRKLWESLDEARRVKTAIRQRSKSVRAILGVLEEKRFKELAVRRLRTTNGVKLWAQEMVDAFAKLGRVKENLQGSYRTEWEILLMKVFPDIGQIFPDKSNYSNKRGRDVEAKFERYLMESFNSAPSIGRIEPRSFAGELMVNSKKDFNSTRAAVGKSSKSDLQIGAEIKVNSKNKKIDLVFTICDYPASQLLGIASSLTLILEKKFGIAGISIKVSDQWIQGSLESEFAVNSIPQSFGDKLGEIQEILVKEIASL